jgi:lipopolysaccharide transport system ATP-binding protein
MSETVIKVENLSKQYRLGSVGTGSLSHDLNRTWQRIRGKEDPYLKIGEANDRTIKGSSDYVWALKDIDFEVKQGEVLGIIGRNGAGKSTLLKILSRTTTPTTGQIKIKGRIASLLEVGTGFHPELSGRENIFLNGAILGMTKREIKSKFDEIVDFAGVERYIDTPVKRYSSGMYVRLAFGVAAHLEPEILIVDEVLAVGDAEFQKKAMGKMKDVSQQDGRTVIFVSHNMGAVQTLCDTGIILKDGLLTKSGKIDTIIEQYINSTQKNELEYTRRWGNKKAEFLTYKLCDEKGIERKEFFMGDSIFLFLKVKFNEVVKNADLGINLKNNLGDIVTHVTNLDDEFVIFGERDNIKEYKIELKNIYFSPQIYTADIAIVSGSEHFDMLEDVFSLVVYEGNKIKRGRFPSHVKMFVHSNWKEL